jgi:hypothetical protein
MRIDVVLKLELDRHSARKHDGFGLHLGSAEPAERDDG